MHGINKAMIALSDAFENISLIPLDPPPTVFAIASTFAMPQTLIFIDLPLDETVISSLVASS